MRRGIAFALLLLVGLGMAASAEAFESCDDECSPCSGLCSWVCVSCSCCPIGASLPIRSQRTPDLSAMPFLALAEEAPRFCEPRGVFHVPKAA